MKRLLLFPDGDGGHSEANNTSASVGEAPPMSEAAVTGTKTERELKLESELESERARAASAEDGRKKVETENAELRDKFDRYKATVEATKPKAKSILQRLNELPNVLD